MKRIEEIIRSSDWTPALKSPAPESGAQAIYLSVGESQTIQLQGFSDGTRRRPRAQWGADVYLK